MVGIVGSPSVGVSWFAVLSYTIGNGTQLLLAIVIRKALK